MNLKSMMKKERVRDLTIDAGLREMIDIGRRHGEIQEEEEEESIRRKNVFGTSGIWIERENEKERWKGRRV